MTLPAGGVSLALHLHPPLGPPRGVVLLVHAMFAHSAYLREMADALAAAGFVAARLDLRGHGQSTPHPPLGDWTFDEIVSVDHPVAVAALRARYPGQPLWLVGHSLGGMSGLPAEARHGPLYDGIVVLGSGLWDHPGVVGGRRWLRRLVMEGSGLVVRWIGRLPMEAIGWGSDEARSFWLQYVDWIRRRRWEDPTGRPYLDGVAALRLPVIALRGAVDRTVYPDDHAALVCMPQARFVSVPGAGHMDVATIGITAVVDALSAEMPGGL